MNNKQFFHVQRVRLKSVRGLRSVFAFEMIFHIPFNKIDCENLEKLAEDERVNHEVEALIIDTRD